MLFAFVIVLFASLNSELNIEQPWHTQFVLFSLYHFCSCVPNTYIPYCRCCSFVHSLLLLFMPVISLCRAKQQSRTEYFNARAVAEDAMCVCARSARCSNICSAVSVETVELGSSGISFSTNAHRKSDSSRFCANMGHIAVRTFCRVSY